MSIYKTIKIINSNDVTFKITPNNPKYIDKSLPSFKAKPPNLLEKKLNISYLQKINKIQKQANHKCLKLNKKFHDQIQNLKTHRNKTR